MKIAFIVSLFPALSETFVLNQITGLIERGHEVDIFTEYSYNTSKMHPDVVKYRLLERTRTLTPPKNLLYRILKALYLVIANFCNAPLIIIRSLTSLRQLYMVVPFLRHGDYDIVHCHFGTNGALGARLRELGVLSGKLVTTFHGYDVSMYVDLNGDHVYDELFEKGDMFLPISEYWKDKLIRLGGDRNRITVHHMGVDCQSLKFSEAKLGKNAPVMILTIARLVEKKGIEFAIRAVAKIITKYGNIQYNIIGDGPLNTRCANVIAELNAEDKIHLLGWKDATEVHNMIKSSHIYLGPSVTSENGDKEGIPVALMEAMAIGLPVVATWHSGIPELVQNGISGFLVPERDVDSMSEKLGYLIEHPEIWPEMGRAGRVYVETHYEINKLNDRLIEIFQNLLKSDQTTYDK